MAKVGSNNVVDGHTWSQNSYYVLTQNIDLKGDANNKWKPLFFAGGSLDGGGFTISGLYIEVANDSDTNQYGIYGNCIGLFAIVEEATIKNLTVEGVSS